MDTSEIDIEALVRRLIARAAEADDSQDAMRFTQAAANAASAWSCLLRNV